jgi:hypothetical protein
MFVLAKGNEQAFSFHRSISSTRETYSSSERTMKRSRAFSVVVLTLARAGAAAPSVATILLDESSSRARSADRTQQLLRHRIQADASEQLAASLRLHDTTAASYLRNTVAAEDEEHEFVEEEEEHLERRIMAWNDGNSNGEQQSLQGRELGKIFFSSDGLWRDRVREFLGKKRGNGQENSDGEVRQDIFTGAIVRLLLWMVSLRARNSTFAPTAAPIQP